MKTASRPALTQAAPDGAGITSSSVAQPKNAVIAINITKLPGRRSRARRDTSDEAGRPQQLSFTLVSPEPSPSRSEPLRKSRSVAVVAERFANLDQRMTTTDVLRVVGVNRSTIFRWVKRGIFPQRHVTGGWLRSDVEKWLSEKVGTQR